MELRVHLCCVVFFLFLVPLNATQTCRSGPDGEPTIPIFNTLTGKPDCITKTSSDTIVGSGATTVTYSTTTGVYTISSISGGGSSSLAIGTGTATNFVTVITSPTSGISLLNGQFIDTTSGTTNFIALNGSSVTLQGQSVLSLSSAAATYFQPSNATTSNLPEGSNLYYTTTRATTAISGSSPILNQNGVIGIGTNLPGGSTSYIQNRNSLQGGTSFYVLTGTVTGSFFASSTTITGTFGNVTANNDTTDPPLAVKTLFTPENAGNFYHSAYVYGVVPNDAVNGGEFCFTMSTNDLPSDPGTGAQRLKRPEICFAYGDNPQTGAPYIALRPIAGQRPNDPAYTSTVFIAPGTATVYGLLSMNHAPTGANAAIQLDGITNTCLAANSSGVIISTPCGSGSGSITPGATFYVQNGNTLQNGSSFYVALGSATQMSASTVTVNTALVFPDATKMITAPTGYFHEMQAAECVVASTNSASISNSTSQITAAAYFDEVSTQSVHWQGSIVRGYQGGQLSADILFTSSAALVSNGTINWGVYTATATPNVTTTNLDNLAFSVVVTTSVTVLPNSNALQKATVVLSNTTVVNGIYVVYKLEREAGLNDTSQAPGKVVELLVHE